MFKPSKSPPGLRTAEAKGFIKHKDINKMTTKTGPIEFYRQVRAEMQKVTWATRQETIVSVVAVFVMVTIASLFLFFSDQVIAFVVRLILNIGA